MGDCDVSAIFTPQQEKTVSDEDILKEEENTELKTKKKSKRKKSKESNIDNVDCNETEEKEGNGKDKKNSKDKRERKKQDLERLKKSEVACELDEVTKIVDINMFSANRKVSDGSMDTKDKKEYKKNRKSSKVMQRGDEDMVSEIKEWIGSESDEEGADKEDKTELKDKKKQKKNKDGNRKEKKRKEKAEDLPITDEDQSGDTSEASSRIQTPNNIEEGELTGFEQPEDSKKDKSGNKFKDNMKKAKGFFKRKFSKSKKDEVEEISIKPEADEVQKAWEIDVEMEDKSSKDKKKKGKKSKNKTKETIEIESESRQSSAASQSRDAIPVVADAFFDGTATTDVEDLDEDFIEEVAIT